MKKILSIITLAMSATVLVASVAYAVIGDIPQVSLVVVPTDTTLSLTWEKATGSTSTVIRYKTTGYPANTGDGTLVSSTSYHTVISGLTAGTSYYIKAWGYDGAIYSTTAAQALMTTQGATMSDVTLPTQTIPIETNQAPDETGFNLEPFSGMISWFNNSPNGLGMPEEYAWEFGAMLGIVGVGLITFMKLKNFFLAFVVVFVLSCIAVRLTLVQGYVVGVELFVGAGTWALDHYYQ